MFFTKHGFSLFLRRLQGEQPQARPTGFSRITRHESRNTAFMLFTSHETRNFCCPVTASLPTISRHFPPFPGISRPPHPPPDQGSDRRPPFSVGRTTSAVRRSSRRTPGLVPLRRTQNEPMLRKTNVLDCANEEAFYMTLTPDRTARRAVLVNRYNRVAWISHHAARHGAAVRGKTVRTRRGSPGARLPCPLPLLTSGRPAMPGGPAACSGVRPGDDQAMGRTVYTPRRRP